MPVTRSDWNTEPCVISSTQHKERIQDLGPNMNMPSVFGFHRRSGIYWQLIVWNNMTRAIESTAMNLWVPRTARNLLIADTKQHEVGWLLSTWQWTFGLNARHGNSLLLNNNQSQYIASGAPSTEAMKVRIAVSKQFCHDMREKHCDRPWEG
jgi:hypothetical protein